MTLTTDFGLADSYVGEMKARLLALCPQVVPVDITHQVPPFDAELAAYFLQRAAPVFPTGTIHVAVVDPGVGGERHALAVETATATFLAPDNGLLTPFLEGAKVRALLPSRITNQPPAATFHGRDLFAPAAALLATGKEVEELSTDLAAPVHWKRRGNGGRILHVDHFGNCVTSFTREDMEAGGFTALVAGAHRIQHIVKTYAEARAGCPVILLGSGGHLEIALKEDSAAARLGLHRGLSLRLEREKTCP